MSWLDARRPWLGARRRWLVWALLGAGCQSYVDLAELSSHGDTAVAFDAELFVGVGVSMNGELEVLKAVNAAGDDVVVELSSGGGVALPGTEYCVFRSANPMGVFAAMGLPKARPTLVGELDGTVCTSTSARSCFLVCEAPSAVWRVDE